MAAIQTRAGGKAGVARSPDLPWKTRFRKAFLTRKRTVELEPERINHPLLKTLPEGAPIMGDWVATGRAPALSKFVLNADVHFTGPGLNKKMKLDDGKHPEPNVIHEIRNVRTGEVADVKYYANRDNGGYEVHLRDQRTALPPDSLGIANPEEVRLLMAHGEALGGRVTPGYPVKKGMTVFRHPVEKHVVWKDVGIAEPRGRRDALVTVKEKKPY